MTIDIRHLQQFVALAEELHFTRAADRMHVTQPTLTSQIKQLEAELGLSLFHRSTRSVSLTDAGTRLLVKARVATGTFAEVFDTAASLRGGSVGHVTLGLPTRLRGKVRHDIIRRVSLDAPSIALDFSIENNARLIERVVSGDLEAAICYGPVPSGSLRTRVLYTDHAVAVMPVSHPLAGRPSVSLAELTTDPLILPSERFYADGGVIENWYRGAGIQRTVSTMHWDYDDTHSAVAQGLGIEITPSMLTNPRAASGIAVVRVIEAEIMDAPLFVVCRADDDSPVVSTVIACIAACFE